MSKEDFNPWQLPVNGNGHLNGNANGVHHASGIVETPASGRRVLLDIDLRRVARVWPLVIVFSILGFFAAQTVLRYAIPKYRAGMSVNIQQKEEISLGQAFFGTRDPFNDKLAWFRSPAVAKKVVDELDLRYNATLKGFIRNKDLYKIIRWRILDSKGAANTQSLAFTIIPAKDGFICKYAQTEIKAAWGIPFKVGALDVIVEKLKNVPDGKEILCTSIDPWSIAFNLSRSLQIYSIKESNIIDISYVDISTERAVDILNTLVAVYNTSLVSEKEESFSKAIEFIERRLGPLNKELDSLENSTASFKSQKGFVGLSSNGTLYQQQMFAADQQLVELRLQKQVLESVENYINNPSLKDENLSLVGITDSYLQSLLIQFQKLKIDRQSMAQVVTENNTNLKLMDQQLADVKNNILLQVSNYKRNMLLAESNANLNISRAKDLVRNTPSDEKILLDKARQQNIKEQLFLLLLQKREEAAVARASVTVNTKVLTPAITPTTPISPDTPKILAAFIIGGAILPALFAIVKELMNRRIISKRQLERNAGIPVLAELEYDRDFSSKSVIMDYKDRSLFSEQVRSLRANLSFYVKNEQPFFILITSSMSGEGKSFISSNLARSFSMQGKRVALVELDLRRPKLSKRFNIKNDNGISSVFIGKATPQQIAVPLFENEVVDLFPSGPVPPNPSELISSAAAEKFRKYLSENYDVIVIDTPPYGIVSDAQLISSWANVTLVITRFNMTLIDQVHEINNWKMNRIFSNVAIVFNAIQIKGYYGYKYGHYYYRRQKGYNYYAPREEKAEISN